jgi:hypothetical protein
VLHRWRAGGTPCPLNPKSLTVSHAEAACSDACFFYFRRQGTPRWYENGNGCSGNRVDAQAAWL